jgi:two-component system chemotaxis response regulator CheB
MPGHDVIVVGFSAGGVEALTRIIADLPADLPAAILIVHHFPAHSVSTLPRILRRVGGLPAAHAVDGERIRPGHIYVGRPQRHLLVNGDRIQLSHGPKENGYRPAIDSLFRTAARSYGPRVIGVLLSGTLDDGTNGLQVIKQCGGLAVVQRPEEALFGDMPANAMQLVAVDYVESAAALGRLLTRLVSQSAALHAATERFQEAAAEGERNSESIRQLLLSGTPDDSGVVTEPKATEASASFMRAASGKSSR